MEHLAESKRGSFDFTEVGLDFTANLAPNLRVGRQLFARRDLPPPELESDEAVLRYVVTHAGAVGYVSAGADISGAKSLDVR